MDNTNRNFDIGDNVICLESGVIGTVLRFYIPTACEEQTLVQTADGPDYHAPTRTWRKLSANEKVGYIADCSFKGFISGIDLASGPDITGGLLNKHGKYVTTFARNHGLTISEAHEQPMVKAHLECMNALEREKEQAQNRCFFRSATD